MISKEAWINLIATQLNLFVNSIKEFVNYEFNKTHTHYRNYLEFASTALDGRTDFEDVMVEVDANKFNLPEKTITNLKELYDLINKLYGDCKELSDFEIIRRPEWEQIIPLARTCLEALKDINKDFLGKIGMKNHQEWINQIKEGLKTIADPIQGFINYEFLKCIKNILISYNI